MIDDKLERRDVEIINDHCMRLGKGLHAQLMALREIPVAGRTEYVNGQILYLKHQLSTIKQLMNMARQRELKIPNA